MIFLGIPPSLVVVKGAQIISMLSSSLRTRPGDLDSGFVRSPRPHIRAILWRANTVRPRPAINRGGKYAGLE